MRRVILKSSVFIIILIAFNRLFWIWLPDGWENPNFYNKQRVFFDHYKTETNTLFFGSSRTFAQIDPALFDSLNATHGLDTRSYMLASSGVFNNEMFTHIDEFFKNPRAPANLQYLFVELNNDVLPYKQNLFTPRQAYYVTPESIGDFFRQVTAQNLTISKAFEEQCNYLASMIVGLTHVGYGKEKLKAVAISDHSNDSLWIRGKGHYALSIRNPLHRKGSYLDRYNGFMADTSVLAKALQRIDSVSNMSTPTRFNPLVYQKYLDLITKLKALGVHVVIMLPLNRLINGELMCLYHALPDIHKMNLCTVAYQIPELHRADHWFDIGHINADGVVLYTTAFAHEFSKLITQDQY